MKKSYVTVAEFAQILRLHPNTIYKAIKEGKINAFRLGVGKGNAYRIPVSEMIRMSEQNMMDIHRKILNTIKNTWNETSIRQAD
jgi:excisionase family DNA binding protein